MHGRTIQEWLHAEKIDWNVFWSFIDRCDRYVKKNRSPGARARNGWNWPAHTYKAPEIVRARLNSDGSIRSTYAQIAAELDLDYPNKVTFIAGIVDTALRVVNHPRKRMLWKKG